MHKKALDQQLPLLFVINTAFPLPPLPSLFYSSALSLRFLVPRLRTSPTLPSTRVFFDLVLRTAIDAPLPFLSAGFVGRGGVPAGVEVPGAEAHAWL